jgi:hypothetical protein
VSWYLSKVCRAGPTVKTGEQDFSNYFVGPRCSVRAWLGVG